MTKERIEYLHSLTKDTGSGVVRARLLTECLDAIESLERELLEARNLLHSIGVTLGVDCWQHLCADGVGGCTAISEAARAMMRKQIVAMTPTPPTPEREYE